MFAGKRAVFFDAGFTLLEPVASVADIYYGEACRLDCDLDEAVFRARLADAWKEVNRCYRSAHPDLESSEELEREAWRRFTGEVARPFPKLALAHGAWLERLFAHFDSSAAWRPMPGVMEILSAIRELGLIVGVVSNWHSSLHEILDRHGLSKQVDFVLTSAAAGRKKPHRDIFHQALARAGVRADETIHIGDSWDDDIEGGRAAGLAVIYVSSTPPPEAAAAGIPWYQSLAEIEVFSPS